MKIILTFVCLCLSLKSFSQKGAVEEFRSLINKPKNVNDKLLWSGYYNDAKYSWPVFFFENGLIAVVTTSIYGADELIKDISDPSAPNKYGSIFEWGTFEIVNDTVNAIIFRNYSEAKSKLFSNFHPVHFRGIIKDKNSIVDWRALPPFLKTKYPVIDESPSTLTYRPLSEKRSIDSSKAWVNVYRK